MGRSRGFQFTWNNYSDDDIKYLTNDINFEYLIFGFEHGLLENTAHLQGFIYFNNPKTFEACRKLLKNNHIEEARCFDALIKYSQKDGDWKEFGIRPQQGKDKKKDERIANIDLIKPDRPWQLDILEMITDKPDYRSIYWFWDAAGNSGKTSFAKYLCVKYGALCISGKGADCKFAVSSYIIKEKKDPTIIIYDIPRTNINYICYETLECIKGGLFFSGKYESQQMYFNNPHVIVFANSFPKTCAGGVPTITEDRWKIYNISLYEGIDNPVIVKPLADSDFKSVEQFNIEHQLSLDV